jgi:hypothetical protein
VFLDGNVLKVSFSYQAYAAVLKDLCQSVLLKVVEEENRVKEQGTVDNKLT